MRDRQQIVDKKKYFNHSFDPKKSTAENVAAGKNAFEGDTLELPRMTQTVHAIIHYKNPTKDAEGKKPKAFDRSIDGVQPFSNNAGTVVRDNPLADDKSSKPHKPKKTVKADGKRLLIGSEVDVHTEDGIEHYATVLGPAKGDTSTDVRVRFADGHVGALLFSCSSVAQPCASAVE